MSVVPVNLAAEDPLSEAVLRKMLASFGPRFAIGYCYVRGGFGYLRRTIRGFNNAAQGTPFVVLTDLNHYECAPLLVQEWLPLPRHPNLIFRVAVREVEAWVMADRSQFARFLRIRESSVPTAVEELGDAKKALLDLGAKSPNRKLRRDLCPPPGSLRVQGPDYNGRLGAFVAQRWAPANAANNSPSLARALEKLAVFQPTWRETR